MANSQRPWLNFDIEVTGVFKSGDNAVWLIVKIANFSDFPANNVRAMALGHFRLDGLGGMGGARQQIAEDRDFLLKALVGQQGEVFGDAIFPREPDPHEIPTPAYINDPDECLTNAANPSARVTVGVHYTFKGGVGQTFKTFKLRNIREAIRNGPAETDPPMAFAPATAVTAKLDPASFIAI